LAAPPAKASDRKEQGMKTTMYTQMSIDGKIALVSKASGGLFSIMRPEQLRYVHDCRGRVDAIMVGGRTVELANPTLTNHNDLSKSPLRVVVTASLDIPESAHLLTDGFPCVFATIGKSRENAGVIERAGKTVLYCGEDALDFALLFQILEERYAVRSIMLEGGGSLNWSLVSQGFVDELEIMILPVIFGGRDTPSLVDGEGFSSMDLVPMFSLYALEDQGNMLLLKYRAIPKQ